MKCVAHALLLGTLVTTSAILVDGSLAGTMKREVDLQRSGVRSPDGARTRLARDGHLEMALRSQSATAQVRVALRRPASLAEKDRLILEGRAEVPSRLSLCIARVHLVGASPRDEMVYDPDFLLPLEWNRQTLLLDEFTGPKLPEVQSVVLDLWAPDEVGQEYKLHIRRCEFLSPTQVAAELRTTATPRPRIEPRAVAVPPEDCRWASFGPGGGGWYRTVAISPHTGDCFLGADVGGIYRSTDGCRSWQIVNAGVPNLYINTITFHPLDPKIVFAGCNGGVLRSVDGGNTWSIQRDGFPPLRTFGQSAPISAIAVDPVEPDNVFAGVGHERDYGKLPRDTEGGRIYKSCDGGRTWKAHQLPSDRTKELSVLSLQFDPRDHLRLFASTQGGLFLTSDGGDTWQSRGSGLEAYTTTMLVVDRNSPDTLLLAYARGPEKRGGVLKSTDGGLHWLPSNQGLPECEDAWRIIADPQKSNTYYLGWHRRSGLFVTRNGGTTWQAVNPSASLNSAWFLPGENVTGIDIDPRNSHRLVYCNDMDIYQTMDAGKTWDQVATDLVQPPSENHAAVWRGRGCEILCAGGPQALAVDPTNPKTVYFGYWDTQAWKSDDGGLTCYRMTSGIPRNWGRMGAVVLDPDNPDILWMSVGENRGNQRIYQSINAGGDFHLVGHAGSGMPPGAIFSIIVDPTSPADRRTLYAAVTEHGVFKSDDGGMNWQERSKGLPDDSRMPMQLAMDPKDPQRLFLASTSHSHSESHTRAHGYLARTLNGGETWEVLKRDVEPQCIVVDPFDSQKIYAGNRNFSGVDDPNAFYRSLDGGNTWQSFDQTQFLAGPGSHDGDKGVRVFLSGLAADPLHPGVLFAICKDEGYDISNGRGVFRSVDWGETWKPISTLGLDNLRAATLVIDPVNPWRLYVGTGGNGFYRFGSRAE